MTHSSHFIYHNIALDVCLRTTQKDIALFPSAQLIEKNLTQILHIILFQTLPPNLTLILFLIRSKCSFICSIPKTEQYIPWSLCYMSCGALVGTKKQLSESSNSVSKVKLNPLFTHDTLGQQMLPHPFKYLQVPTCVYATLIFYHC